MFIAWLSEGYVEGFKESTTKPPRLCTNLRGLKFPLNLISFARRVEPFLIGILKQCHVKIDGLIQKRRADETERRKHAMSLSWL
ncbi:hypothetical protein AOLI_G00281720 [Acnodon oligacanthus]